MLLRRGVLPLVEEAEGEVALDRHRLVQGLGPVGVQLQQPLDDLLRLPERPAGGLGVPDVGLALEALDAGELHVGGRQLPEERRVVAGVSGQGLQVLERALDEVLAEGRGAGDRAHLRLDVEDDGVDEPAGLVEAPLRHTGLPRGGHDPTHEAGRHQDRRGHRGAVPSHELAGAVADRVRPGGDRQPFEMAPEVLRQLVGRPITPLGLLAQRLEDDRVQVAAQLGARRGRPRWAPLGSVWQTVSTIASSESVCTS